VLSGALLRSVEFGEWSVELRKAPPTPHFTLHTPHSTLNTQKYKNIKI